MSVRGVWWSGKQNGKPERQKQKQLFGIPVFFSLSQATTLPFIALDQIVIKRYIWYYSYYMSFVESVKEWEEKENSIKNIHVFSLRCGITACIIECGCRFFGGVASMFSFCRLYFFASSMTSSDVPGNVAASYRFVSSSFPSSLLTLNIFMHTSTIRFIGEEVALFLIMKRFLFPLLLNHFTSLYSITNFRVRHKYMPTPSSTLYQTPSPEYIRSIQHIWVEWVSDWLALVNS